MSLVNRRKAQLKGVCGKDADVGKIAEFGHIGDSLGFNSNYPSAPRPAELGNLDQTESRRGRGVTVKSAQQDP